MLVKVGTLDIEFLQIKCILPGFHIIIPIILGSATDCLLHRVPGTSVGTGLGRKPEPHLNGRHCAGLVCLHVKEVIVSLIPGIGTGNKRACTIIALLLENHGCQHIRAYP